MNRLCVLAATQLALAPAKNWLVRWQKQHERFPYFPSDRDAIAELNARARDQGIPASIHVRESGQELRLYGSDYYVGLYPSLQGDGYILSHMEPIDLPTYDKLADGVLLLRGARLRLYEQLIHFPPGSTNCKEQIWRAWQELERDRQRQRTDQQPREALSVVQQRYLDALSSIIERTYELEQARYALSSSISYVKWTSTDGKRSGAHDIYEFHLLNPVEIWQERYLLCIKGVPDLRGRVLSLQGKRLKLKFETTINRERIPAQGEFEIVPNRSIFRAQSNAVEMFREQTARNRHLLDVLVHRRYQPCKPAQIEYPKKLNPGQGVAFQMALTVPDILLVLGPPGTGKTHTITEIIQYHCTRARARVLVAARTHKAVDNVLSRLPASLEVVRLGHEDRVSAETQHLLLNAKAKTMQAEILKQTAPLFADLSCFLKYEAEITHWRNEALQYAEQLEHYERKALDAQEHLQNVMHRVGLPFQEELEVTEKQLQKYKHRLEKLDRRRERIQQAEEQYAARIHLFLLGWLFVWLVNLSQQRLATTELQYEETRAAHEDLQQEYLKLLAQFQQALWEDSEYRTAFEEMQEIEKIYSEIVQKGTRNIRLLHGTIDRMVSEEMPQEITSSTIQQYIAWYDQYYELFSRRAKLLRDWRAHLEQPHAQLEPELIHYADVIGATCIGVAARETLEDLDFDVAIVDEAGQICLTDLLVPLARANRAVLVGDHQQLPPFVSNEAQEWLKGLEQQEEPEEFPSHMDQQMIRQIVTKSAFELLFSNAEQNGHLVRLTDQFRMPQVIADFASRHFYEGKLYTTRREKVIGAAHDDPLFSRPLAVIDTTTEALKGLRELSRTQSEDWGGEGYSNLLEARIIAALVSCYERSNTPWIVIVPYRAQVQCIVELLQRQLQAPALPWEERVSTVDAFQGSECEKVIYGFTRSNPQGRVGFLAELRRLNVALTRAKEQLIVVGDFSTLRRAKNEPFRVLMNAFYQHAQLHGEVLSYDQCVQRIRDRRP